MASKSSPFSATPLSKLFRPARRRSAWALRNGNPPAQMTNGSRSTTSAAAQQSEVDVKSEPRWSYTPIAMKAPVPSRLPRRDAPWKVNEDPQKLDAVYNRMLGRDGHLMLTEETKWLAVTHKSFDHGRRGFNDRLSYLGKRIVELEVTLALLGSSSRRTRTLPPDVHGREPFLHPATEGVEILNGAAKAHFLHHMQISRLSQQYGLDDVIRWNPRKPDSLLVSGMSMVLTQAVFAIVGAVALERGGGEANRIVRERIIGPLGVRTTAVAETS